ncbi:MAG: ketoacyl-ACP synthase III [Spirochaetales bacterium]|nr:ketoacyl-ACP synthase III [Spirochaetales bacterium]
MKVYIKAVGSYVPEKKLTNSDLSKIVDTSDEWIVSHTGIKNRHIAADNEAASDLATKAAQQALDSAGMDAKDLDLILVGTATADFPGFPSTACIVQGNLGAENAGAVDLAAACTGFIYGLEIAKNFILTGSAKNILVIGCEVMSRIIDWKDRNTCVLFGDGAGAGIVTANDENDNSEIIFSLLKAEGTGARYVERTAGGSRYPIHPGKPMEETPYTKMDGRKVYTFAVRVLVDTVNRLLAHKNLTIDDIAYIVPHQANLRIIEAAAKRLGYPVSKFYMNIDEYANTSAATIPIALTEMVQKNLLKRGDIILTIGFGGGLTYGGNLICW